ncbi:NUDIX hydrolase [Gorillibacterium timonense]|uniref:NUDIX hydrolase n=1 Tax=Gorillibacterium timonense TaxID=1689269 RepID=UPI00071C5AC7|nr:NUDIX domain-containing protein [Gorillibacterium timonense]
MLVISAGGVVYRKGENGLEIQLIKDRFGKMTLAKGKLEAGETVEEAALREIAEETGTVGRIVDKLVNISYEDKVHASMKEVHYFLVEAIGGDDRVQVEEIDGLGWYKPEEAWKLQRSSGYGNNEEVLAKAFALLKLEGPHK